MENYKTFGDSMYDIKLKSAEREQIFEVSEESIIIKEFENSLPTDKQKLMNIKIKVNNTLREESRGSMRYSIFMMFLFKINDKLESK